MKFEIRDFNDRIAGDEVSALKIEFVIVRNTPKLNLTLYVPIFILMVLFLGSILVPSKLWICSSKFSPLPVNHHKSLGISQPTHTFQPTDTF